MRVSHILAVAAVLVFAVGLKLAFSPPMKAAADITLVPRMNVMQMQANHRDLAVQKMQDMTFVFSDGD
jgi:hypothetical protein